MLKNGTLNVIDYIKWRGDLLFSNDPISEVDAYVFSQLSFLNINEELNDEIVPLKKVYSDFLTNHKDLKLGLVVPGEIVHLCKETIKAKRFKDVLVSDFVEEFDELKKEQFSAVTFHINDELMVIAFQGTDDSLIGWLEDFEMLKSEPVPAQLASVHYVNKVATKFNNKKIILTGHSKGGNLSMYSGIFSSKEIQKRIVKIYNLDGPGFEQCKIDQFDLSIVGNVIHTIIPSRSVVGMIFSQLGHISVVKTCNKGLFAHDGFSWEVEGRKFSRAKELNNENREFSNALDEIIENMSSEDRIRMCNSLEKYIHSLNTHDLIEFKETKNLLKIFQNANQFTREDRRIGTKLLKIAVMYKVL